jgi:hypothetical protein
MRRIFILLGSFALLVGCAHNRGATGSVYDADYDQGTSVNTGVSSDVSTATNLDNHIERARQPEYPTQSNPDLNKF